MGETQEEGGSYLGVVLLGSEAAGIGAPAAHRERRRRLQRAAALWWLGRRWRGRGGPVSDGETLGRVGL